MATSFVRRLLGLGSETASESLGDTETVRRIARRLESLPKERARFLAAFAYVLGRVAHADLDISEQESQAMERIVVRLGEIPDEQAALVVEIAKSQTRLFGGTEGYLVTRELQAISSPEQKQQVMDCLFEVSAADESISATEENLIWQIATELGLGREEYVRVRSRWADKRAVLKK
jgi:uncharacterized tellurite resistance protein B-like protein